MKSTCWDTRATDSIIKSGQKDTEASQACSAICCVPLFAWRFEAKMAKQMFNVANVRYRFLSNYGHSVRFLNRFGNVFIHAVRYQKCFSLLVV